MNGHPHGVAIALARPEPDRKLPGVGEIAIVGPPMRGEGTYVMRSLALVEDDPRLRIHLDICPRPEIGDSVAGNRNALVGAGPA